jgi:hypothetical protein
LVALVFMVVWVGLHDEEAPEKGRMQLLASQWAGVVPHQPYWEPVIYISRRSRTEYGSGHTALVGSALCVSILGSAVTSKGNRDQREEGESGEAHYDYDYSIRDNWRRSEWTVETR